jgi:hypothetical protein
VITRVKKFLRNTFQDKYREKWYLAVTTVTAVLVPWGIASDDDAQRWTALGLNVVTLAFAAVNTRSVPRGVLYSTLAAAQGVAQIFGILDGNQTLSLLALAGAILGTSTAAAYTRVPNSSGFSDNQIANTPVVSAKYNPPTE